MVVGSAIPLELQHAVIDAIDWRHKTLLSTCLVCSEWCARAQPRLFRTVCIAYESGGTQALSGAVVIAFKDFCSFVNSSRRSRELESYNSG